MIAMPSLNPSITGLGTTAIAPVGLDTWKFDPPKTPATSPATIAVVRPAEAPSPVVIPHVGRRARFGWTERLWNGSA